MGVIAVYGVEGAARVMYSGLHMLQHRGQEGAGMVVFDASGKGVHHRGLGLVSEVFDHNPFLKQEGSLGIGGTQYANAAKGGLDNVQPLFFQHKSGDFAVAGDGNLVNYRQIKDYLENRGSIFHTSTDAELLANLIKKTSSEARIYHIVCAST